MAFKKNSKFKKRNKFKRYSFIDRKSYYANKADNGKTSAEQDYAIGYLRGMNGIRDRTIGSESGDRGNDAGLKFWSKMIKTKI